MNFRNVEGGTSDFVSSLTSGYDRIGFVPVPKPDYAASYSKPAREEQKNYGSVPVPTPEPSLFPTVRRSYYTNSEQQQRNSNAEQTNVSPDTGERNSPDYSQVAQPTEEELQAAQGFSVPQSALPGGSISG